MRDRPWANPASDPSSQRVYSLIFNGLTGALTEFMPLSERARVSAAIYDSLRGGGVEIRVDDGLAKLREADFLASVAAGVDRLAAILASLEVTSANLSADVAARAEEIARPRIEAAEREAAVRVLDVERQSDATAQRWADLERELRRIIGVQERRANSADAQVKRVEALRRTLPFNGELEQLLHEALHPKAEATDA